VNHLKLEIETLQGKISDYQTKEATLRSRVEQLQSANTAAEDNMQHFYGKLGRIRGSLTKEVDKVWHCIVYYRCHTV
jgi:FtsZ-binding cell division protein ZapB